MNKYVLTIGTGKKLYLDMAVNLACSFLYWHLVSDIKFQIVTDQPQLIPHFLRDKIEVITIKQGEFGNGFSPKLHLDQLVSEGQTLFIDSDCLIFGDLSLVFQLFKGHPVSVSGGYIAEGEWFGDIKKICSQFNVPHLPKFNGGIYYVEKGAVVNEVYQCARELEKQYDEIGFVRLRERPNDEVLMALALQLHKQTPVEDDGTVMSDLQACQGNYEIDIIKGRRLLINPEAPHPLNQSWYPFHKVSPLIVHFLGHYTSQYQYKREVARLSHHFNGKLTVLSEVIIRIKIEYPLRLKITLKNIFRSSFHLLFGARRVKPSERL